MDSNRSFKRLKAEARDSLKGKWGLAIAFYMDQSLCKGYSCSFLQ